MELKAGYKRAEVGVVPDDWACVKLYEVARAFNGKAGGRGGSWLRVFKTKHVYDGNVRPFQPEFVPDERAGKVPRATYLETGDILTPNTAHGTIGRVSVVPALEFASVCDGQVMVIRSLDQVQFDSRFAFQFLSSHAGRQQILEREVGSIFGPARGQTHLYPNDVLTLSVPLPPYNEQAVIAEALSDADALIESLEQLIAKKRHIKQGAMQELLTGENRLPGFYEGWETKRLGDIVDIQKGQLITSGTKTHGDVPVIAGGKQPAYFHNVANRQGRTITISASGASAGYVARYDMPIFASDCSTISEGAGYSLDFIFYQLLLRQNLIYKAQTGGAQPHIHAVDLIPLEIDIPQLNEQSTI
ncbi:MAG: restriction endonuclease subunit S, partial [Deltaproteobacteria bacterium]|nr:restriction endonuclease subunit S [Deltaproteobacteria bacterium]